MPTIDARLASRFLAVVGIAFTLLPGHCAFAETVVRLKNGLQIKGGIIELSSISANPFEAASKGQVETRPIWMIDDGLRRIYVHQHAMVASHQPADALRDTSIKLWQPVPTGGHAIQSAGAILRISPFNVYGQRVIEMQGKEGPVALVQGITELTPSYAKLETLKNEIDYQLDMRIATSSIPDDQLIGILHQQLQNQDPVGGRLELVRFFRDLGRFEFARSELEEAIRLEPADEGLKRQRRTLIQQEAAQILGEALQRLTAGQPALAKTMLQGFPIAAVAEEDKIRIEQAIERIEVDERLAAELIQRLRDQLSTLGEAERQGLDALMDEIAGSLRPSTLARMDDYVRLGADESLTLESRLALGLGGWILGPGAGMQNLAQVRTLWEVRVLVAAYLAETNPVKRDELLVRIRALEGAQPEYVAKMLPWLPPPLPIPDASAGEVPGLYRIEFQLASSLRFHYTLQLPPEYDPLRRYPCIVALPPRGGGPDAEIDWWAGPYRESMGMRLGQATRQGFIVLVPDWSGGTGDSYQFTPAEHHRVLAAMRDALRRFSIDSDRVFLAGHGQGATAAWDIAGAHPDLWGGLICIGGEAEKYTQQYWQNLRTLPMYFVSGEIAGVEPPLVRNGGTWNRYMRPEFQCMLVTYKGRGEEHFYDDIHAIFQWMRSPSHRRNAAPRDIAVRTMRRGDQSFWWVELTEILDTVVINPLLWDRTKRSAPPAEVDVGVVDPANVRISKVPANRIAVYLTPEMGLNLQDRVLVRWGNRRAYVEGGDIGVILEDARSRADRQHPYWAKVVLP